MVAPGPLEVILFQRIWRVWRLTEDPTDLRDDGKHQHDLVKRPLEGNSPEWGCQMTKIEMVEWPVWGESCQSNGTTWRKGCDSFVAKSLVWLYQCNCASVISISLYAGYVQEQDIDLRHASFLNIHRNLRACLLCTNLNWVLLRTPHHPARVK